MIDDTELGFRRRRFEHLLAAQGADAVRTDRERDERTAEAQPILDASAGRRARAPSPTTEITTSLLISPHTAKTHLNRALMTPGARDRAQLVIVAFETRATRPDGQPPAQSVPKTYRSPHPRPS